MHSHTDIGYTDRQEKIERYHVDFIKQVVELNRQIENGEAPEAAGFKWTCENYWQVENFLKSASEQDIQDFHRFIKLGHIDVSLNYLNMTELVDDKVLRKKIASGTEWAQSIGFLGESALTADVNGYSWGYADALYENGVKNLFSCIHGHHGLSPLRYQQRPFKWKTPHGNEVTVWSGGHYMLGNEFLLIPNTRSTYHLRDEFEHDLATDPFEVTEKRIFKYVNALKKSGYDYSYVPVMISGVLSDNAPANGKIMNSIRKWNEKHAANIELELTTLSKFFEIANKETDLPVYSGDWNDWWADGVGSTPAATKIYKDAQRKYHIAQKLDVCNELKIKEKLRKTEGNLMMYAEHTWGYSSSVSEPWNTLVNDLEYRKTGYATQANVGASKILDEILQKYGEVSISPDRPKKFKIINPHDEEITDVATFLIEHWEDVNGAVIDDGNIHRLIAVDTTNHEKYPTQALKTARATEIKVFVHLQAKEQKEIAVILDKQEELDYDLLLTRGSEGVQDIFAEGDRVSSSRIENDFFKISFDNKRGIKELQLKNGMKSLLEDDPLYAPFSGVYEETPVRTNPVEERRVMGRNRKGKFVKRSAAELFDLRIISDGEIFTNVVLDYRLPGTKIYSTDLKIYKLVPRIDATIRIHKKSIWAPENVYVPLPFTLKNAEKFIDKSGCLIRPRIDQLPGTNMEFYLCQNGIAYTSSEETLLLLCRDAPLLTFGSLEPHEIKLSDEFSSDKNQETSYSWMMNNFWETNFKAELGGFYEFSYTLNYVDKPMTQSELATGLTNLSQGIVGISI